MSWSRARSVDPAVAAAIGATAIHDLRNMLAVAESSAHLAAGELVSDPKFAARHLERVQRNLRASQELLSRCISVARGEPIMGRRVVVRDLVDAALDSVLVPPHIEIVRDAASLEAPIVCDPTLLARAVANLIQNAVEAPRPNGVERGRVMISCDPADLSVQESPEIPSWLAIFISDDGPGLTTELAESGSTKNNGLGLGLVAVRAIVAAHGGTVQIVPRISWATTFALRLPAHAQDPIVEP